MNVFLHHLSVEKSLYPEFWLRSQFVRPCIVEDFDLLDPSDKEAVVDLPEELYLRWEACLEQFHEIQRRMLLYKPEVEE